MRHPLRLIIHAPIRERRDFRRTLVGLEHALCVQMVGATYTYDLLPAVKPRKGREHLIVERLAEQLQEDWTLCVWNADRLLSEIEQIVQAGRGEGPITGRRVADAFKAIGSATEEQIIDLQTFKRFPNGHYVQIIAARADFDRDSLPPALRRRSKAVARKSRPTSEDFWGVLHPLIMTNADAENALTSYKRWVAANRPRPPRSDRGDEHPHL